MIVIKNARNKAGEIVTVDISSAENQVIDASSLTILPAVIDPHVHFRTPGLEHKEDWRHAAKAAIDGGVSTVFDMPNTVPPTITKATLAAKKHLIDEQLKEVNIPLRYELFFGADKHHLDQIPLVKNNIIGIKVFMGCSTGNLVIDDDESLRKVFSIAAKNNLIVAVHAEDEKLMHERKTHYHDPANYACHSLIRNVEVATRAVAKAIQLAKEFDARLYVLHISTKEETLLIEAAKKSGLPVFAETTPHHLFFNDSAYATLKGKAVVNPPLRDASHQPVLLNAIKTGIIDTIGSDHAPHTDAEKSQHYGVCPSGMPGIEFLLPLLLNAHHEGKLTLEEIEHITSANAKSIFKLPDHQDYVLVNLTKTKTITSTKSKCGYTPYHGMTLTGWPVYIIVNGRVFEI